MKKKNKKIFKYTILSAIVATVAAAAVVCGILKHEYDNFSIDLRNWENDD